MLPILVVLGFSQPYLQLLLFMLKARMVSLQLLEFL